MWLTSRTLARIFDHFSISLRAAACLRRRVARKYNIDFSSQARGSAATGDHSGGKRKTVHVSPCRVSCVYSIWLVPPTTEKVHKVPHRGFGVMMRVCVVWLFKLFNKPMKAISMILFALRIFMYIVQLSICAEVNERRKCFVVLQIGYYIPLNLRLKISQDFSALI